MTQAPPDEPPPSLAEARELKRISELLSRWNSAGILSREEMIALEAATELVSLAEMALPEAWPDGENWPPLREWIVEPPVRVARGTKVEFVKVVEQREHVIGYVLDHTCTALFEFNTPSDETFRRMLTLSNPKTAGLGTLPSLRHFLDQAVSTRDEWGDITSDEKMGPASDPIRIEYEHLYDYDTWLDEVTRFSGHLKKMYDSSPAKVYPNEIAQWYSEQFERLVREAYVIGRKIREGELRGQFVDAAKHLKTEQSNAGKSVGGQWAKEGENRRRHIAKLVVQLTENRGEQLSTSALANYLYNNWPEEIDQIRAHGDAIKLPGKQYMYKQIARARRDGLLPPRQVQQPKSG